MIDFERSIFENTRDRVLLCAHRGVSGANIPCNTMAAFKAAILSGADMIELDVSKSADGRYFVFHPGMESAHLRSEKRICDLDSAEVKRLRFVNQDDCPTDYGINTLEEVLDYLRGKCYVNVDKYWTDIPGITACIRRCGVEKQVVVKTAVKDSHIAELQTYAPDLMFMPIVRRTDDVTDMLLEKGIRCIGAEVLFETEDEPVASEAYIDAMHEKGLVVFVNAIIYDKDAILSAGHSDDTSFIRSCADGWGWLAERGFDIIQTDFCAHASGYLKTRSFR
jgi:glycerophosphoryl diester phosphodiesterase